MKIEYKEEAIKLCTEGILERLYLERLCLKHEGDIATCVLVYEGSYTSLEIRKVAESQQKTERDAAQAWCTPKTEKIADPYPYNEGEGARICKKRKNVR